MDRVDVMLEPVRAFLIPIGAFLPRLAFAALILFGGFLVARALRFAVVKALRAINLHVVTERSGLDGFLRRGGTEIDTIDLFGHLVYWLVILIALNIAFSSFGTNPVTEMLLRVTWFVPRVMVAVLIIAFGSYFARFIGNAVITYCRSIDLRDGDVLGKLAQYAIMAFVIMIAIDHLDIGGTVVRDAFLIVLAGLVFAVALAFGLGGRKWAAALLERWWPSNDPR